jgi:DNA-binding NtrC family response regulator
MATPLQRDSRPEPAGELRLEDLERWGQGGDARAPLPLREWLALAEAWRIAQALREHRGNRSATARALGIGRRTLYTKMEKLGLVPSWTVARGGAEPEV